MFRLVVICGCLMAVAQAGIINGGIITGVPIPAGQPTLALRPVITAASSSSNIVRGIGPLGTIVGGTNLIGVQQGLTTFLAPSGLDRGVAINHYGLGRNGSPIIGYL